MEYTFKVWVDGNYYYEDEEYEVEIELTDEDYDNLKKIVKGYDGDLSRGLMPILEKSNDDLYQLFYDRIFPDVFFYESYIDIYGKTGALIHDIFKTPAVFIRKLPGYHIVCRRRGQCIFVFKVKL